MSDTLTALVRHIETAALGMIATNPAEALRLVLLASVIREARR